MLANYVLWMLLFGVMLLLGNVLRQLLPRKKGEPPLVFHWIPFLGNSVMYGINPYEFFIRCRKKVSTDTGCSP